MSNWPFQKLWQAAVPVGFRRALHPARVGLARRKVMSVVRKQKADLAVGPVIVSGLLSESKGISEAARLSVIGLESAGLDVIRHDARELFSHGVRADSPLLTTTGGVLVVHMNPDEAMQELALLPASAWLNRYRIGYWAYELSMAPRHWVDAAEVFHEIWVPSAFVAESMRRAGFKGPLRVMPHPVGLMKLSGQPRRSEFGIPPDAFVVLAMGDLQSSVTRKNLKSAIDIYCRTFAPMDGAVLVIKTQTTDIRAKSKARHESPRPNRPDVILLHETLTAQGVRDLIASSNVLLSPHRGEGFGLVLAEAFMLGVPALATGWSGNMEFMSGLPDLAIEFDLVPVRDPDGVYGLPGADWAEPRLDDGARKLRQLVSNIEIRQRLSREGQRAVEALSQSWSRSALSLMPAFDRSAERG